MKSTGNNPSSHSARTKWLVLGAALTLTAGAGLSACMSAGSCDDNCEDDGDGGDGGDGGGGGKGGSGGGGSSDPVLAAEVENCDAYPTVGEVETKLLKVKCGTGGACHTGQTPPELKSEKMYERLLDVAPETYCKDDKLIDSGDVEKSFFSAKLAEMPKCGTSDGEAGTRMPFAKPALNEADMTCIQEYMKAVIRAKAE